MEKEMKWTWYNVYFLSKSFKLCLLFISNHSLFFSSVLIFIRATDTTVDIAINFKPFFFFDRELHFLLDPYWGLNLDFPTSQASSAFPLTWVHACVSFFSIVLLRDYLTEMRLFIICDTRMDSKKANISLFSSSKVL